MKRFVYEIIESFRIAFAQIRANKMRSALTALGVIIGIVAVTLMGTAIRGIETGFQNSLSMLGDDVLYIQKWPWGPTEDWWNYINRPNFKHQDAEKLNRIIQATEDSLLEVAVPVVGRGSSIKHGDSKVNGVMTFGTTADYARLQALDFGSGRFFGEAEAASGRNICILGKDVADALFPNQEAIDQTVLINEHPFTVIGVLAKQGSFLGLMSFDNQAVMPLEAFRKYFSSRRGAEIRVKAKGKLVLQDAKEELVGAMRRVRGQLPGERDNFSINEQQAFKTQLDGVTKVIAMAGFFITGLALFVGAIGIMNITFVSVKERTKEIGTRKALGARRRTILLQFLIEAVSICLVGGIAGMAFAYSIFIIIHLQMPSLPVVFSIDLVILSVVISVLTGIFSGFAPALGASRLDPVVALRYE